MMERNLYTGRVNAGVVNLLLENARFAELTYRISQYFDDTFASGIAAQNAMLTTLSTLLRTKVKTPEAAKAAKDISLRRKPVYQGDLYRQSSKRPVPQHESGTVWPEP